METKEIRTNSFWGIWSMLTKNEMPETTCGLGWHMIFSILTIPFWIFPGIFINGIIKLFNKQHDILTYYNYIVINVILMVIGIIYHAAGSNGKNVELTFWHTYWTGIWFGALLVIGVVVIVLIFGGIVEGAKWLWFKFTDSLSNENTLSDVYYSLKDKHCSKINWK